MVGCAPVGSEASLVWALLTVWLNTQKAGQELGEEFVEHRDRRLAGMGESGRSMWLNVCSMTLLSASPSTFSISANMPLVSGA
eukprot:7829935-Pyramimonas_sp.AAC.1